MKFKDWLAEESANDLGKGATPGASDNPTQRVMQTDKVLDKSLCNPKIAQTAAVKLRTAPNSRELTKNAFSLAGKIAGNNPAQTATDTTQVAQGLVSRFTGQPLKKISGF